MPPRDTSILSEPAPARMARPPSRDGYVTTLIGALAIITVLYVGRDVFVPVALAILLSFVLAPILVILRRLKMPKTLSVMAAVVVTFLALLAIGAVVASQVGQLASDLPQYQWNLQEKIRSLKGATAGSGTMERVAGMLQDLSTELNRPQPQPRSPGESSERTPLPVEIHQPAPGTLGMLSSVLQPLIHPLATTGIIFIFLIFILLQREDLRNRFIRLAGAHDIQRTTAALDDAGARLSRFFLAQVVLNAGFGAVIGIGLTLIGVPSAILWGLLAAVLRFVPYVGAIIAAVLPSALALAVDPGWTMVLATVALFVVIEPIVGHIIEPLVYGRSTGLSPVAVIASATFWTWLWGPIGLVLATPLTLCLVVLGRHVEQLEFLDVMLGDRPPLSAPELFYQRMLAGDPVEATSTAEDYLKDQPLASYVDEVALPALRLAQHDHARGALGEERIERIRASVGELIYNLGPGDEEPLAVQRGEGGALPGWIDRSPLPSAWTGDHPVLCIGSRTGLDEAAAMLMALVFTAHGLPARVEGPAALQRGHLAKLDANAAALVMVSSLDSGGMAQLRYAVRRLRRHLPDVAVLLGAWGAHGDRNARSALEEIDDPSVTTAADAVAAAARLAHGAQEAGRTHGTAGPSLRLPAEQ
ncbi:ABC transporter permease [Azorhizobium oxalatiphilum]|uniref:ABC transporter permease n=1 Tax=Azorhizobium oxalatiphilum TaxID=980631 RepID=A0A917FAB1_9HYPH|nr:AI-2E family transporter [Azorhizobium oxalatiphilum]GGF60073.1 ABC transporter permease [Azorhizobium oxalatiphilum]